MKKVILFCVILLQIGSVINAQNRVFYDKDFVKMQNPTGYRYVTTLKGGDSVSTVLIAKERRTKYAEGIVLDGKKLSFDGKVTYFDDNEKIAKVRFFDNGRPIGFTKLDKDLQQKIFKEQHDRNFLISINNDGAFCVVFGDYFSLDAKIDNFHVIGKFVSNRDLTLDGVIHYYNGLQDLIDVRTFAKGSEIPFTATTADIQEPYETMEIISHEAEGFIEVKEELKKFILKCKITGANGVVGINTNVMLDSSDGLSISNRQLESTRLKYIFIQGTTIKYKNKAY